MNMQFDPNVIMNADSSYDSEAQYESYYSEDEPEISLPRERIQGSKSEVE